MRIYVKNEKSESIDSKRDETTAVMRDCDQVEDNLHCHRNKLWLL
jgi:hypothetical protein